jgi:hypothetical protein
LKCDFCKTKKATHSISFVKVTEWSENPPSVSSCEVEEEWALCLVHYKQAKEEMTPSFMRVERGKHK